MLDESPDFGLFEPLPEREPTDLTTYIADRRQVSLSRLTERVLNYLGPDEFQVSKQRIGSGYFEVLVERFSSSGRTGFEDFMDALHQAGRIYSRLWREGASVFARRKGVVRGLREYLKVSREFGPPPQATTQA